MNDSKIPVRYAKALLELAIEKNIPDKVYNDFLIIREIVQIAEVKEIIKSPVIPSFKKNEIITGILPKEINETVISFINMIFRNKREIYLEGIARNIITTYKKYKNIKTVEIITATEIDQAQQEKFKAHILENFKAVIELETKTDHEIIGGFIVQVDDLLYDASVKRQLRNIQNTLLQEKI